MCDLTIIKRSHAGFLGMCIQCGHYQLGFGSVQWRLSYDGLANLTRMIEKDYEDNKGLDFPHVKKFVYPTPTDEVNLTLTLHELSLLLPLLKSGFLRGTPQSLTFQQLNLN